MSDKLRTYNRRPEGAWDSTHDLAEAWRMLDWHEQYNECSCEILEHQNTYYVVPSECWEYREQQSDEQQK